MCTFSAVIIFLSQCVNTSIQSNDPRGNIYAGSASCRQCHQSIYDSYIATSHFNTTRLSSIANVLGNFSDGHNTYVYNDSTKIVMEKRDSSLYQVLYINGKEQEAHRFDITFGIKHAQTFIYWNENKTFELPVSYYNSLNTWAESPGYPSKEPYFKRQVIAGCYECHSSYIKSDLKMTPKGSEESLSRETLIVGIDCERCHGPAINHVNYHLAYPNEKKAKYIVSSFDLTRQQKLDACAICHSGNDKQKEISGFSFTMGDTLANFYLPFAVSKNHNSDFDVHGNQYGLLSQSRCFLESRTLECGSCHDPHTNASNDLTVYSRKCQTCHNNPDHSSLKMDPAMAIAAKSNCIDCHMPKQTSRAISFELEGSDLRSAYLLRTHKIAVYGNEKTKKFIWDSKKKKVSE